MCREMEGTQNCCVRHGGPERGVGAGHSRLHSAAEEWMDASGEAAAGNEVGLRRARTEQPGGCGGEADADGEARPERPGGRRRRGRPATGATRAAKSTPAARQAATSVTGRWHAAAAWPAPRAPYPVHDAAARETTSSLPVLLEIEGFGFRVLLYTTRTEECVPVMVILCWR
jgi:hypothetical protein